MLEEVLLDKNWKSVMEVLEESIIIFDSMGRKVFCNKGGREFVSEKSLSFLVKSVVKNGQSISKHVFKDKWEASLFPVGLNGKTHYVYVVIKDLDVLDASGKLDEARQLNRDLKTVIESSYDGIGIIDKDGTLLDVNYSYLRITGLNARESGVGRKVQDLEKEGHVSKAVGAMVLRQKKTVTIKQNIKTGKEILITGSPIFDESGKIVRVVANIRDLTELNMLKEEVEKSKSLSDRYYSELKELRAYRWMSEKIVANSMEMKKVLDTAVKVAGVDSTVLVTGESGVGKEVVAKVIHKASSRKDEPFININCGAIPEHLLESELFGYKKGAFTGASAEGKLGIFQVAHNGTLMLDEIGEMPLNLQVKMLRAIQEGEILPVGATKPVKVNVRIIALTNKNLKEMVKEGTFREDLYYRLNVVPLSIPPLRERRGDILGLARTFLDKCNEKYGMNKTFNSEVLKAFEAYDWPGNVRELETTVERLLVTTDEDEIKTNHLPDHFNFNEFSREEALTDKLQINVDSLLPLKKAVEMLEKELVTKAVKKHGSSRLAAKELGVDHSTIVRKAKKHNITW